MAAKCYFIFLKEEKFKSAFKKQNLSRNLGKGFAERVHKRGISTSRTATLITTTSIRKPKKPHWLGWWDKFVQKARFKKCVCLCHICQIFVQRRATLKIIMNKK